MTDEEFDPICEVEFIDTQTGTKLTARLGAPVWDQSKDLYYCLTEIAGLEDGKRQRVYGVGPFGALEFALLRFRKMFAKQARDLRTADGDAPHMLFPKEIPWVYGSDVYQKLCKMVDDEVQKIEDERTRRREGRDRDEGEP
jgi:hypothetical protein